jgi:uncharacterized protein (DUF1330 family)
MTAYWLARARVDEPEQYVRYASQVPGILERYGGRVVNRHGTGTPYRRAKGTPRWSGLGCAGEIVVEP